MTEEQSRILNLIALYSVICKGAKDDDILQFYEIACNNQDVFIINKPIQKEECWIYDIKINPEILDKLELL